MKCPICQKAMRQAVKVFIGDSTFKIIFVCDKCKSMAEEIEKPSNSIW